MFNQLRGGDGADILIGGPNGNEFAVESGDIVLGETMTGGAGFDSINLLSSSATFDLRLAAIDNIERLAFNIQANATAILAGTQIGTGRIVEVVGSLRSVTQTLGVIGLEVDLSGVTFTNWGTAGQSISIGGSPHDNTLTGSSENDSVFGEDGDDTLDGGAGSDTLTGGADDDIFILAPGYGTETITDFAAGAASGDRVDASGFVYIRTLADILGRATPVGADTLIDFGGGDTLTLQNVNKADLNFEDFVGLSAVGNDFGGNGTGDLLWRQVGGSAVTTWQMQGASAQANAFQADVSPEFQIATVGDFNGDGRADLAWRHTGGLLTTWQMDGGQANPNVLQAQVSNDFEIQGSGDFNGGGRDDLLWRHTSGTITTWEMNGAAATPNVFTAFVPNDWHIAGIGDFNGDGRDDLLWRNDNGALTTWEMNGNTATPNVFQAFVTPDWNIVGTGDFNADGRDDLLWRHDSGTITTWQMNGNTAQTNVFTALVGNDFSVAQIGDFNADGRDDIMWRHTSGAIASWEMNGNTATPNVFQAHVGTDFTLFNQQYDLV